MTVDPLCLRCMLPRAAMSGIKTASALLNHDHSRAERLQKWKAAAADDCI